MSLGKAARLLEDCSQCFQLLLKEAWQPKNIKGFLSLLRFMGSFSTWQRELASNASQQRYQIATASYPSVQELPGLSVRSPSPCSRGWQRQIEVPALESAKGPQQELLSPMCVCCGGTGKQSLLSEGSWPAAEFLSGSDTVLPLNCPSSKISMRKNPLVSTRAKRNQVLFSTKVWFIFSDTFSAECTFYVFYQKIPQ